MKIGKKWLYPAVILTVSIGCFFNTSISGSIPAEVSSQQRADVIIIDSLVLFGRLEKSPVEFLHDLHTQALAPKNKDCNTCHLSKNQGIFPKFKRLEDTDRTLVMNIYHTGCISCHGEMNLAQEKTGPIDCDGCHTGKEKYLFSRQPMGFDKSLHFTHSQAHQNRCDKCHHGYDETKKELFYEKGKEGTCRYCHGEKTEENRISMGQASHLACINCHINTEVKPESTPPITCAGCHDPLEQQKLEQQRITKQIQIPRMDRNQPDLVLLKPEFQDPIVEGTKSRMDFVPFDHKAHEASNDTCRVCHHESLQPCNVCHTLNGSSNGISPPDTPPDTGLGRKGVTLERAMHTFDSTKSCQGCHDASKQEKNCAGCHAGMGQPREMQTEACLNCHSVPVESLEKSSTQDDEISLARSALQYGKERKMTYSLDDIPDVVRIQRLSQKYEAVDFPHQQVVNGLRARIKGNGLSGFFHNGDETICQGCHHNSPASLHPPQCQSCHSNQWDEKIPLKPGILGAYHRQCMGCHQQMNIEKPMGCTECHKLKNPE